ncbi:MAG: type II secretion system F family protein [Candidatus Gracilibacteria bacterium]|jgi:type IV pilus assembly protein PilC
MVPAVKKKGWNMEISLGGISATELLFFTRHLSLALKSGLTLFETLTMLQDLASGKLKQVLTKIMYLLQAGESFYSSLSHYPQYFSALYLNLVKTGELSGTLEKNLQYLAENLQKTRALKQKVKSAMIYPVFILSAVIVLGFAMSILVLPKILPLFKTLDVELPATTKLLIFVTDMMSAHGAFIIGGFVAFVIFMAWFLRQNFVKPVSHFVILKIPVFGKISQNLNLELFTHTLSTLLLSGIPLDKSLKITADATENRVYRAAISHFVIAIEKGNTLAESFASYPKLFPKMFKYMIAMGERTGSLDSTLKYLSDFYESEVDTTVKNLSTIIEPFLLIFIGGIVGVVALSILGPIYSITGGIKK